MSHRAFSKRVCKEKRDFDEMKNAAAEFYRVSRVPRDIERALHELFLHRPADLHGYLSMSSAAVSSHLVPNSQERTEHVTAAVLWINEPLNSMLKDQNPCDQLKIDDILSTFFMDRCLEEKEVWDRERPKVIPSSSPPQTKDKKVINKGKKSSIVEKPFPPVEPQKPVLHGSLAIGSVSLAVAKTGAQIQGIRLYEYIAALRNQEPPTQFHIPVSLVTLLSCGKTSPGKLNLLEEVILIPKVGQQVKQIITMALEVQKEMMRIMNTLTNGGASEAFVCDSGALAVSHERPEQPLDLITEACTNLGVPLGTQIHLALNCAAHELMDPSKGKYEVAAGVLKSPDELVDLYQTLISKYPAVALIDPFRQEDRAQWEKLSSMIGNSCSLLSDVSYNSQEPPIPGVRGRILKHINETTVSDLIHMTSEQQGSVLMGTTCSEPCNGDSLSDIAVGLGLHYVKLGGLSGAERMTKYNRLISIEEELAQQGILVFKEKHPPPLFPDSPHTHSGTTEGARSGLEEHSSHLIQTDF
ncbi:enolase 4 isoform X2 [Oreochromis aureus]|uniref:enolase 4 isoform X2 n=1 Tax=Oreochromis aureus TaxID=47969 RepID=UPI00195384CE|nr:enolase 4 isoform X2 [Oreochromis aureus]